MFQIQDYLKPSFINETASTNPFAKGQAAPVRKKPQANLKIQVSGADFLITRKTSASEKTLACIVSQELFFIRDEKTKEDVLVNADTLKSFIGMTDVIELVDTETEEQCVWLDSLCKGKTFAEKLMLIWEQAPIRKLMQKGLVNIQSCDLDTKYMRVAASPGILSARYLDAFFRRLDTEKKKLASKALGKIILDRVCYYVNHNQNDNPIMKYSSILEWLVSDDCLRLFEETDGWGISGTMDFVMEYIRSPMRHIANSNRFLSIMYKKFERNPHTGMYTYVEPRIFKRPDLQNYLIYGAIEEGFSYDADQFYHSYADYLRMREALARVSAKEYDLYPEFLCSAEARISAVHLQYQSELAKIDDQEWAEYVKYLKKYETKSDEAGLQIVAPMTKDDMLLEATQQHNCLSSYIERVKNGECAIFFLRKTAAPQKSYVTIEVRCDGSLGQVLAACNRQPDRNALEFVREWHKQFFVNAKATAELAA